VRQGLSGAELSFKVPSAGEEREKNGSKFAIFRRKPLNMLRLEEYLGSLNATLGPFFVHICYAKLRSEREKIAMTWGDVNGWVLGSALFHCARLKGNSTQGGFVLRLCICVLEAFMAWMSIL
jgi:hypothetical protein